MSSTAGNTRMHVQELCPGSFLLEIPERGISWLFNAWPDAVKFLIQRGLGLTGIVYPDLRFQGEKGTSCNLVEFPLLYALFNQGMLLRGEKPLLMGTPRQLELASESFFRGLFGFRDVSEMADCDLEEGECRDLLREIEGLSPLSGIRPPEDFLELVPLAPMEDARAGIEASEVQGVHIWKEALNVFGVRYGGEEVRVDCNLPPGKDYRPPLEMDMKQFAYRLFQVVDTGEEDGFSPKSCMHTLIQWRDRIICVDLPMNVSYLLERVGVSRFEIDAVIFTHNHDDHIGELGMLLHMDRKVTVLCPRIIWRSILLKGAAMLGMDMEELASYFDYVPIRYGEEFDYAGLHILAHPSIHSVPCAVYRIRTIVGGEWKSYGHMSDILNFQRCQALVERGVISAERFRCYRDFLLQPTTVKKVDVGATADTLDVAVHGFWRDFEEDASEHIVLGHIRSDQLDERATVTVGQLAVAGSSRQVGFQEPSAYRDKQRERALPYLADYLFSLVGSRVKAGEVARRQVLDYAHILADCEIRTIQPNTPFLKRGGRSTFVDLVISGTGSVWIPEGEEWRSAAKVNAGDVIGDMGVLLEVPRSASIRSDTYMRVLRIPALLFHEVAAGLGLFDNLEGDESLLQRRWRLRERLQGSPLLSSQVPIYLQNRIAQDAREVHVPADQCLDLAGGSGLFVGTNAAFELTSRGRRLPPETVGQPVFGELRFLHGRADPYEVRVRTDVTVLHLERERFAWMLDVPIFRLRLRQLAERREILIHGARPAS